MKDHISACVCTYHRNKILEQLLKELALQETGGFFDFSVVVVDNDAAGPARETVMRLKAELGLGISYGIEPGQVIPAARIHALCFARGNYIGIIDDDELPHQGRPPSEPVARYAGDRTSQEEGLLVKS